LEPQEREQESKTGNRLVKTERLKGQRCFQEIKEKGRSRSGKYLTVLQLNNQLDYSRIGVIATRKVAGSVLRNRWRRIIKEIFRTQVKCRLKGVDLIFILRHACREVASLHIFDAAENEIHKILGQTK
jgi:ribonuclease P protein component